MQYYQLYVVRELGAENNIRTSETEIKKRLEKRAQ
jgi:hypothetical protein